MTSHQTKPEPSPESVAEADASYQASADLDRQDLLLLKQAPSLIEQLRGLAGPDEAISQRVRFGAEQSLIALSERIGRACRRDLPLHRA